MYVYSHKEYINNIRALRLINMRTQTTTIIEICKVIIAITTYTTG